MHYKALVQSIESGLHAANRSHTAVPYQPYLFARTRSLTSFLSIGHQTPPPFLSGCCTQRGFTERHAESAREALVTHFANSLTYGYHQFKTWQARNTKPVNLFYT